MMIEDDDRLFFSHEESFKAPKNKREFKSVTQDGVEGGSEKNRRPSVSEVGPFSVGEILGKGGFGEVREGINQLTGECVALKFLRRSDIQSMLAVERTANEIQCLTTLKHRNIIKLQMVSNTASYDKRYLLITTSYDKKIAEFSNR